MEPERTFPVRVALFKTTLLLDLGQFTNGENMLKRIVLGTFVMLLLVFASTACHTVKGAGEDVESVGNAVQNSTSP
jgi:predicted small secreted protein